MNDWALVYLAVMAVALAIMALVQVGVVIALLKVAKQVSATTQEVRKELKPLVEKANRISDDAARAAALAVAQVERIDRLVSSATSRVDETLTLIQGAVIQPVRQGAAVFTAVRAALSAFRSWQGRVRPTREDEEALFVG